MFTGLVQALGTVVHVSRRRGSTRLAIASTLRPAQMRRGDSIAVDGVCLTVVSRSGNRFVAVSLRLYFCGGLVKYADVI